MKARVSLDWVIELPDEEGVSLEEKVQRYMTQQLHKRLGNVLPDLVVTDIQQIHPWEQ
jgi:hypothetical protein